MNIVYLIGNGFDLNLGMQTGYTHFYKYYTQLPRDNDSLVVRTFKENLEKDLENWSDLELALGEYLGRLDADQAVELHANLVESLSEYIKLEEAMFPFDYSMRSIFFDYLMNPHRFLLESETQAVATFRQGLSLPWRFTIITFNYSRSVERIVKQTEVTIASNIYLSGLEHIHGFTDNRFALGVDDVSQIGNEAIRTNKRVTDRYVKSDYNLASRSTHASKCIKWLNETDLICTFGLSFGDTDKRWWELCGDSLKKGRKMIMFVNNKDKIFTNNQPIDLQEEEEAIKDRFLSKANVAENLRNGIKRNMYVAYNTGMFQLDIGRRKT